MNNQLWQSFETINKNRRAVKYFTGESIADDDMKAILAAAQFAPSSYNAQPYELHWIKDKPVCDAIRNACRDQHAATSAATFVVVVARWEKAVESSALFLEYVENSGLYNEKSKAYFHDKRRSLIRFLRLAPLWVFGILKSIVTLFTTHVILFPFGKSGMYQWAAKQSIFAAQTLMLAAQARGIDSCPMEGFNPFKVAKILHLKRSVIPVIISFGKRNTDKPLTPQWRLPFDKVVVVH